MHLEGELLVQVAVAENLHPLGSLVNETRELEGVHVDHCSRLEGVGEGLHVDRRHLDGKKVAEAALRQTTLDWGLPALEVRLAEVAGVTGLLTLLPLASGLALIR